MPLGEQKKYCIISHYLSKIGRFFHNRLTVNSQIHLQAKISTMTPILISVTAVPFYQANEGILVADRRIWPLHFRKLFSPTTYFTPLTLCYWSHCPQNLETFRDPREFIVKIPCQLVQTLDFPFITSKVGDLLMPIWGLNVCPNRMRMLPNKFRSQLNDLF